MSASFSPSFRFLLSKRTFHCSISKLTDKSDIDTAPNMASKLFALFFTSSKQSSAYIISVGSNGNGNWNKPMSGIIRISCETSYAISSTSVSISYVSISVRGICKQYSIAGKMGVNDSSNRCILPLLISFNADTSDTRRIGSMSSSFPLNRITYL